MTGDEYRVAIKASARKRSGAVGEWVNDHGPRRTFASRALAREWARECAQPGASVWIQDASPWDGSDVDGYLVGGPRPGTSGARGAQSQLPDAKP